MGPKREISATGRGTAGASFEAQAREAWRSLFEDLRAKGTVPRDVAVERVFLEDVRAIESARAARAAAYRGAGVDHPPAVSFVEQPPAESGVALIVLAHALPPRRPEDGSPHLLEGLPPGVEGSATRDGETRRIVLTGIAGGEPGDRLDFDAQAARLFARASSCLMREGLSFRQVARTWIFLADVGRDYGALNRARRAFFETSDVSPAPASTGIGGGPAAAGRLAALDLIAFDGLQPEAMRPLSAPTMNEAPSYGSDFSRGFEVRLADRRLLFVSGTASIDARGEVLHAGDARAQADRMLKNIERLLGGAGAGFADLSHAVTYVKRPGDEPAVRAACAAAGLPADLPHVICVAEVCRPEWLCEMEAYGVTAVPAAAGSAAPSS
ncbi:MAG TPA: RidA family protein [Candidatus Polarisedimenticolia bacterium]|nr:RidA family protein [Candidatus Polarisedimenticolia bacterium]